MTLPIEKTLEEIRQEMFDRVGAVQAEYAAKGWLPRLMSLTKGVIRGMLELWNWGLYQLYGFMMSVLAEAFPSESSGAWLDLHCRQVDVYRLPATRQAEDYGAAANVTAGMINEIATIVPGVDSVENRADWLISEGSDKEDDAALFERYVLAWQEKNGCTKHAYEAWARSVVGVASVKIVDQHPRGQGTVDVVITGAAGAPTQLLIDAVDAVVQAKAPINDDALVKGPELVAVDIVGELEIVSGDPPAILAEAEQRLRGLFYGGAAVKGIVPMRVGQDIPLDLLRWAVLGVTAGRVKRTTWTSPAEDV